MYDYGRFDFRQKNFYLNFAKGEMRYSIGRTKEFVRLRDYYISENRFVKEQELNLRPDERQAFFDFLETNNLPENSEYLYNYVYDNCATKIRDVVTTVITDSIYFPYSYVEKGKSVRDLMDDYLGGQPWGDLIIDLGLGSQIDVEAKPEVYMFLPDYIFLAFSEAQVRRDSVVVPLVRESRVLYQNTETEVKKGLMTPFNTFLLLFFVVGLVTNRDFKKQKRSHWLDVLLFSAVGFLGLWFVFLWFGTAHLSKENWNLLWAFPLHIPLVYFLKRAYFQPFFTRVYRFLAVVHFLTLVFWVAIPQVMHHALIPLILALVLREFYISYDLGRLKFNKR